MMDKTKDISNSKMDFQNLISCIECHAEEKNLDVIKETLKTIVNICAEEKLGKDAFREVGGLDFLLDFLLNTDDVVVIEYCLNVITFVIDGNVQNQMHLTEEKIFKILQAIFAKMSYPLKVLKNAVILFSTILFQNRLAQDLAYQTGSIHSMIDLYKSFYPACDNFTDSKSIDRLKIWLDINRSLCFAVNNPLNEKNQDICSVLFPMTLKLIEISANAEIIEKSSLFLSLSISNNVNNQNSFAEHDGFLTLKRSLNKTFEQIQTYMNECNNIISKEVVMRISSLLSIISDSVMDHKKNATLCGKLGIVSILVQFLFIEALNISIVKKIFLALGHCIDSCKENRSFILDTSYFDTLLKKYLESEDQELHAAARYLLQVCLDEPLMEMVKENGPQNTEYHKENFQSPFTLEENFDTTKNISENLSLPNNNEEIYARHQSNSDCLRKLLHVPKFMTPFQERTNYGDYIGFKLQHKSSNWEVPNVGGDSFLFKNGSPKSDLESELSLQSAGHFYKKQKMKNRTYQNDYDLNERKSINGTNFSLLDKENRDTSKNNCSFNPKNIVFNCNSKKNSNKLELCDETTKQFSIRSNSGHTSSAKRSKFGEPYNLSFSLKNNYGFCDHSVHSKNKEESCAYPDGLGRTEPAETISKTIPPSFSDKSNNQDNFNSCPHFEKKISTNYNCSKPCSVSGEFTPVKIKPFPKSHSVTSNDPSQKYKFNKQHRPGCLEVVVLPGTTCCDHKLASMIELLKVCPIEDNQCHT